MTKTPKDSGSDKYRDFDPLKDQFRDSITLAPEVVKALEKKDIALLVIDLQYLDATPGEGVFKDLDRLGIPEESQDYYFYQLRHVVLPNVKRLQKVFRDNGMEVIHTRIQSLTDDGRDRSIGHKRLGLHAAPGSKEAEFLPEVAPIGDEIIINKTASGVFTSTNIAYVLRNLDISGLFICGVYTNECVSTAVRDGCDLGYHMTLIGDSCASVTPELQRATIKILRDRYARVLTTDEAIDELNALNT